VPPRVTLAANPLRPAQGPAAIRVRERGAGPAVVLLHGGWGYEVYPFDLPLEALGGRFHVLAPDRVGYGDTAPAGELPADFHRRMAAETVLTLDALGVDRAALWGHSDGAVVAAWTAILFPSRVSALVLEALHFLAAKPGSIEFFRACVDAPERFGASIAAALARDHGPRWPEVLASCGRAWLRIIAEGLAGRPDVFAGRLGEVVAPTLLVHGRHDPRTEPGEVEAALRALPAARVEWLDAGHAPHASAAAAERCTAAVAAFLDAALRSDAA
jgi:pimeloyl-ACP methyl ester carboxylesterase